MKKQFILFASALTVGSMLMFTSCKKEDTTAPTLTVDGNTAAYTVTQSLPSTAGAGTWTNPTATAQDDEDGAITTIDVTGTVDPNTKGSYTLTYSVSDAAGNSTQIIVTVEIVNDAEAFAGSYQVADTCGISVTFAYPQTITTSSTINNRIHFNKFADYQNNSNIYAVVAGSTNGSIVTLPSQTANGIGTNSHNHSFNGSGTVNAQSPFMFNIAYVDNDLTAAATANCDADFTKQ